MINQCQYQSGPIALDCRYNHKLLLLFIFRIKPVCSYLHVSNRRISEIYPQNIRRKFTTLSIRAAYIAEVTVQSLPKIWRPRDSRCRLIISSIIVDFRWAFSPENLFNCHPWSSIFKYSFRFVPSRESSYVHQEWFQSHTFVGE